MLGGGVVVYQPAIVMANSIIRKASSEGIMISPMKLQKLLYFVYKKHLKDTDQKLFDERFQVWEYGPVLASVYHAFKRYGPKPITEYAVRDFDDAPYFVSKDTPEFYDALNFVWDKYWEYAAMPLSDLTHQDGTAWKKALDRNHLYISDDDILEEDWLM
jgi:uncharacterized phage-associated protein